MRKSRLRRLIKLTFVKFSSMNLRVKASLLILLPVIAVVVLSSAIGYFQQRERALASMSLLASQTGRVIENALKRDMLLSDFERIQSTFDSIGEDERIQLLYILDTSGKVVFAPKGKGVGRSLDNRDETCQPCHRLPASERPSGVVVTNAEGTRVFRSMHPIENRPECSACHDPDQELIGVLLTDFSIAPVENALAVDVRNNMAWWIGTVGVMVILVNLAIHHMVLRRISVLEQAITNFGHRGHPSRLAETPDDEIGRLSATFNVMTDQITEREKDNKILSEALQRRIAERGELLKRLIHAQEEERKRVARELHDEMGQALGSLALNIELARRSLQEDRETAWANLDRAGEIVSASTEQMYDLILGLRPSALDDLGLTTALKAHAQRTLKPAQISFDLETRDLTRRLPAEVETTLFRVFQEALTNIVRHSKAKHVTLRLALRDGYVEGEISDNGVGFDASPTSTAVKGARGLGLLGMRERVEQCHGEIEIHSQPGKGTRIWVQIPTGNKKDGNRDSNPDR